MKYWILVFFQFAILSCFGQVDSLRPWEEDYDWRIIGAIDNGKGSIRSAEYEPRNTESVGFLIAADRKVYDQLRVGVSFSKKWIKNQDEELLRYKESDYNFGIRENIWVRDIDGNYITTVGAYLTYPIRWRRLSIEPTLNFTSVISNVDFGYKELSRDFGTNNYVLSEIWSETEVNSPLYVYPSVQFILPTAPYSLSLKMEYAYARSNGTLFKEIEQVAGLSTRIEELYRSRYRAINLSMGFVWSF